MSTFPNGAILEVVSSLEALFNQSAISVPVNAALLMGRGSAVTITTQEFLLCVFPVQRHIWVSQSNSESFNLVQIVQHMPSMFQPSALCVRVLHNRRE